MTEAINAHQGANEEDIVDILENSTDPFIFLTGKAGAGKSLGIRRFIQSTRKNVVVCATTGTAALNCGGMTIHKLFNIYTIKPLDDNDIREISQKQRKAVKIADVLIIDECSMLSAPQLDAIDKILRVCRKRHDVPFGGVQIVAVGDMNQLPVIARGNEWEVHKGKYASPHFFSAPCFKTHPMVVYSLEKIFRQKESEKDFLEILNAVRDGKIDQAVLDKLNSRYRPDFTVQPGYVSLCPTNAMVDAVNKRELDKIPESPVEYIAEIEGDFKVSNCPADERLILKPGAQVMFLRNDSEGKYVNGTVGIVTVCGADNLVVDVAGTKIDVQRATWDEAKYEVVKDRIEQDIVGSMTQFPVKLSFAMSIHKSQGKTCERCIIDPRGIFENGQLYVSLSRCTSLSGLILKNKVTRSDIRVDQKVLDWMSLIQKSGRYRKIYQRFIEQSTVKPAEQEKTTLEQSVARIQSGSFPSDEEILQFKSLPESEFKDVAGKCAIVFLDEIEMLRSEVQKLKRDNASLKGKVTKYENSAKPKKSLFRERTFAEMDFEMGMQNDSE